MKALVAAMLMTGLLVPAAVLAQEWQAYTYPNPGFAIQFPGVPAVEMGTVKNATGVSLPMTRYVVRRNNVTYTVSVVNYSSTNADALSTIVETERSLGASGKVSGATGARVNRYFGRELSLEGTDGSRSAIAIFFVDKHLYTVVGQALPPNVDEKSVDARHFKESLQFPDDGGGFGFGRIAGLFGGGRSAGVAEGAAPAVPAVTADIPPVAARPRAAANVPADAACAGKSAGDAVQLKTPGGSVAATCTLVARPNMAPDQQRAAPPP